jgi:hypothetical protein
VAQAFTASASKLEAELIRQNTSNGFCNFGTAVSFICVKKKGDVGVNKLVGRHSPTMVRDD